jgi:phage terminase large subunit-like protein
MNKLTDIVQWAESSAGFYLSGTKQPIKLAGHQKDILRHVFTQQADGRLPYDTVVYACPKKSGKTTIAALVAEYFALFIEAPNEVYLCANDLEQSQGRSFKAMSQSVRLNPHLSNRADIQRQAIYFDNETMVQALAADYAGAAGSNHGLTVWDELWAYVSERSRRLWDELTPVPTRRISIRFIATYGGFTGESALLEELYNQGRAGEVIPELAHIENGEGQPACRKNGRTFVYWDHQLKAHPGLTIDPEEYHNEQRKTLRPLAFLRIHENRFTSNENAFISPDQWDACYHPDVIPMRPYDDRRIILGADASTSRDLTALVGMYVNRETQTRDIVYCRAWKPVKSELRGGRPTVDLDETVKAEIYRLWEAGNVEKCFFDPYQLHSIGLELQKAGVNMIELPQTSARVESDQAFYDAILTRQLRHFNHPDLNEHIRNAVAIETPRGFRLAKEKTSKKIDLSVAASMAHYGALESEKAPQWLIW